ncbi:MAG: DnaD domain protein [Firmicutes bacterium]|nr:DnaD domain protein [Bacillota bacterium]
MVVITMINKLEQIIKNKDVVIPNLLFYNYRKLNMNAEELILLSYLINEGQCFNPKKISLDLSIPLGELMETLEHLKELDLVQIELKKVNNVRAEVINMEGFYNKLLKLLMDDEPKDNSSKIFDTFEHEFGRTLSPMEYEIINAWKDNNIEEETILLALKEAVYNGVNNLRYIDKILNEWAKKGIKTKDDLENNKRNFSSVKKEYPQEVDYDWLNDEE